MDRVSAAYYVTIGGKRYFVDPNLGISQRGTGLNAIWHDGVQESIVGVIEAVGLTPTDSTIGTADTQLLEAVKILAASGATTISGSGSLTAAEAGLILVNAAGGNIALTLPAAAAANGQPLRFIFARTDTSTNTVTVALAGGDTWLLGGSGTAPIVWGVPVDVLSDGISHFVFLSAPARGMQVFSSSGTFTPPPGVFRVNLSGIGAGGTSGGASGSAASGGGASGSYGEGWVNVTPATGVTVTVGTSPAATTGNGGTGGATSLGAIATFPGGGGSVAVGSGAGAPGTSGGACTGVTLSIPGVAGASGGQIGGTNVPGAGGGAPFFGIGGFSNGPGVYPGTGAGGTQAAVSTTGNAGANGQLIVRW